MSGKAHVTSHAITLHSGQAQESPLSTLSYPPISPLFLPSPVLSGSKLANLLRPFSLREPEKAAALPEKSSFAHSYTLVQYLRLLKLCVWTGWKESTLVCIRLTKEYLINGAAKANIFSCEYGAGIHHFFSLSLNWTQFFFSKNFHWNRKIVTI